ncbi:MAG: serine hydrolase domain-containing protein [Candidatus Geothermincolia bacterium]
MVLLIAITVVAVTLTCVSCGSQQLPSGVVSKLDRLLKVIMEQNGIPGAVAGAWVPGKGTWVRAAGKADIKTGAPEKAALRFRIGSITKTFTVTVILQLVEEGKISLDDKLEKFIGGFKYGDRITIRQLCNMTSGIFAYDDSPGFTEKNVSEPQRQWSPEELVDLARTGEPYFPPGTDWRYCNTNSVLLGVIAEKVTGNGLSDEIKKRIITPLKLTGTLFPGGSELGGAHSHGYVNWAGRWGKPPGEALDDVTYMNPSWGWAAGAMISTLDDLHTWSKALATGQLLSPKMQKERLTWVNIPGGEAIQAKYGLGVYAMGDLIGHDGMLWGYNSGMYYYPAEDATIVILFNRAMDQKDGQWVSPDLPYTMAAGSILFPGKMPWDKK